MLVKSAFLKYDVASNFIGIETILAFRTSNYRSKFFSQEYLVVRLSDFDHTHRFSLQFKVACPR